MKRQILLIVGLFVLLLSNYAFAKPAYMKSFKAAYPAATEIAKCKLCHEAGSYTKLNPYGLDFSSHNYDFKAVEDLDSDGDTVKNIDEINKNVWPGDKESH